MTATEIARRYVAASNRHALGEIGGMLAPDAVYESDRVGAHRGRDRILEMMKGFFARYPDVVWTVEEWSEESPGRVRFEYRVRGTDATDGEELRGAGEEVVEVGDDGLIRRIRVR